MLTKFYQSKLVLVAETFCLTIFPLILLKFFPGWIVYRYGVMLGGLSYVLLFVWSQKISLKKLGLQLVNFIRAVKPLIVPTLLTIFFTIGLYLSLPLKAVYPLGIPGIGTYSIFLSIFRYSLISVPLQEILFRAFLINRVGLVTNNQLFIRAYATVIFMLIHIPFKTPILTLGSFILGWLWVGNFLKFRNIYSVMLSHAIIGLIYVLLMFLMR